MQDELEGRPRLISREPPPALELTVPQLFRANAPLPVSLLPSEPLLEARPFLRFVRAILRRTDGAVLVGRPGDETHAHVLSREDLLLPPLDFGGRRPEDAAHWREADRLGRVYNRGEDGTAPYYWLYAQGLCTIEDQRIVSANFVDGYQELSRPMQERLLEIVQSAYESVPETRLGRPNTAVNLSMPTATEGLI